ncbi:MAG: ATP-binding protein [Methylococcales bacterium]|nr:ATP-binding protein [Methylococcales bacterium]
MTWIVLNGQRSKPVTLWCGGGLCIGVGFLMIGQRPSIPAWMSFPLANVLLFLGYWGRIQSLRLELDLALWRKSWVFVSVIVFLLIFEGIRVGLQDTHIRLGFVSFYHIVMASTVAYYALRIGRERHAPNAYLIVLVHVLLTSIMVLRVIELIISSDHSEAMVTSMVDVKAGVIGILSAVVSSYGYIGLMLDQAISNAAKLKTDKLLILNKNQQVIAHLDRQRSLGAMSASIGHELNQPLTAIMTNAQLAKLGIERGHLQIEQVPDILKKIIFNSRRAHLILEKVRAFIKPTIVEKRPVNLNVLVRETAELIKQDVMLHNIQLELIKQDSSLSVLGDATQLSQVLVNLYRNAMDALQNQSKGKITVSIQSIKNWAVITVEDNGSGITDVVLAQIGEPFFTTKPEGLGLGLSISKAIIEQHGGQLIMGNTPQGGASFDIRLPINPSNS